MNYQEIVRELIRTDCDYKEAKDDERIEETYENASEDAKKAIDDIFISITGFALGSIIAGEYKIQGF